SSATSTSATSATSSSPSSSQPGPSPSSSGRLAASKTAGAQWSSAADDPARWSSQSVLEYHETVSAAVVQPRDLRSRRGLESARSYHRAGEEAEATCQRFFVSCTTTLLTGIPGRTLEMPSPR